MDLSSRIPLIDETARKEAAAVDTPQSVRGLLLEDDLLAKASNTKLDFKIAKSLLHQYARDGNTTNLEEILKSFPDIINVGDDDRLTALHFAARYGRVEIVKVLLKKGADGNSVTRELMTPLHMAAKYCKTEATVATSREEKRDKYKFSSRSLPEGRQEATDEPPVKKIIAKLIATGVMKDPVTLYGMTPLHYAAMKDNLPAAETLIEMGARLNPDPNDPEQTKMVPPLLTACTYGSDSVAQLLLSKGANLELVRPSDKSTAFHIAAFHGKDQTLESLLRRAGSKKRQFLLQTNAEGNTPFCLAVEGSNPKTAKLILQHIEKINQSGKEQWLLHAAASKGNLEVVKVLVEAKADPKKTDNNQRLPIHLAARNNHGAVVEYLVELDKESLEIRDEWGMTPLLLAASYREATEAVKILVDKCGADIGARDHDGRSVVYIASKYNSFKTLEYLIEKLHKTAQRMLSFRTTEQGGPVVRSQLDIIINQPDHNQNTPMHIVCNNGYLETCQLLRNYGASVEKLNEDEETPLHLAARNGRTETVRQLLAYDKSLVGAKDEMGNTPLHLAARGGHDVAAKALLDAGADKNSRNEKNETPLFVAITEGQSDFVRFLVGKGANLEVETENGTLLHEAARRGYSEIIRFLLSQLDTDGKPKTDVTRRLNGKTALEIAIENDKREAALVLVESRQWESLMLSQENLPLTGNKSPRQTPMRELLKRFPDVAITVFNNSILVKEDGIEYNFTQLEDTYMMKDEKGLVLASDIDPFLPGDLQGKLKPEAKTYTQDPDVIYQNHPLKIIANSERMSLLSHPLVLALIKYKWNSLGRYVYYGALSMYFFFITLFTIYVIQTPPPYNTWDNKTQEFHDLTRKLDHFNATCDDLQVEEKPALQVVKVIIIILSLAQMCKELFQMAHRRMAYINFDNLFEWFIYISAVLSVLNFTDCSDYTGVRMTWQWILAALCVFACWINLLLMIRKLPRFGIYVVMFFDIVRTFLRFSLIFILFILAFSIAFFVLLQNRPEFSTPMSAILKTTVMMIGEFEFTAIFHGDESKWVVFFQKCLYRPDERLFGHGLAYPIFFIFCIIMTILLMNLLVGLAVGDIMQVQEKAELRRLCMQIDLVLQIEATIPWVRQKTMRGRYRVFTIKDRTAIRRAIRWVTKKFGFESPIEDPVQIAKSEEEERMIELRQEQRAQGAQIQNLQANVDVLYEKQCQLENMLKALIKELKVEYQDVDG